MTTYIAGTWLAVVTPQASALVASVQGTDAERIAEGLRSRGVGGFVDALTLATGTTVTTLPAFAVAVAEQHGIRVAVRGEATATDIDNVDVPAISGAGVTGWTEALWPTTHGVRLTGGAGENGEELWIVEGAVHADALTWSPHHAVAAPAAAPQPASAVPAVPDAPPVVPEAPPAAPSEGDATVSDAVSHETLVAAYDTMAPEAADVPYDTFFGALWGSDAAEPSASKPPLIAEVPDFAHAQPEPVQPQPVPPVQPQPEPPVQPVQPQQVQPERHAQPAPPQPAAAPEPAPAPAPEPAPAPALGDHDGATISVAALRALAAGSAENPAPPSVPTFATPEQLAKESRGRAVLSTGVQITLDKNIIVGRTPKASRVTGEMPHLVTVPSPSQDISRSHVEIRVEGTAVVAVDLNTTNGTVVRRGGAEPARLHPGEPFVLLNGDIIDLGDGVTITMEDLP